MRLTGFLVKAGAATLGLALGFGLVAAPAGAAPTPSPAAAAPAKPGTKLCTIISKTTGMYELSGLVATANGYYAINDSAEGDDGSKLFQFDANCKLSKTSFNYKSKAS